MLRFLGYLIAFILIVPVLRSLIGWLGRAFTSMTMGEPAKPKVAAGGVLHKDPVCGTYVSEATAVKLVSGGETRFFCSQECLKKHALKS